jgi:hypothetical protein
LVGRLFRLGGFPLGHSSSYGAAWIERLASHIDLFDCMHVPHLYSIFGDLGVSCPMDCLLGCWIGIFLMLFLGDQVTTWVSTASMCNDQPEYF